MNGKLLLKIYHIFYFTLNIQLLSNETENTAPEFDCCSSKQVHTSHH